MKKRLLASILSAIMITSLLPTAAFATRQTTDQRLTEVALKVKNTLGIGNEYTEFSGNLSEEEIVSLWDLRWSKEGENLSVSTTEDGKIYTYNLYKSDEYDYDYTPSTDLRLPKLEKKEAIDTAKKFLDKVLDKSIESVDIDEDSVYLYDDQYYVVNGTINFYGVKSYLTFSVRVNINTNTVSRFGRSIIEDSVIGAVPNKDVQVSSEDAGKELKKPLKLTLQYILDPDTNKAELIYTPDSIDRYYVDAKDKKLVNLDELYRQVDGSSSEDKVYLDEENAIGNAAGSSVDGAELTEVEKEGIAKLEGVLSKEVLGNKLKEITELGLKDYNLSEVYYRLNEETEEVTAQLRFTKKESVKDRIYSKSVTCNAKTGELKSVWSSIPYSENRAVNISESQANNIANQFLAKIWNKELNRSKQTKNDTRTSNEKIMEYEYGYVQVENGYELKSNNISISVDALDGSISRLSKNWVDNVEFESPEGIIDNNEAIDLWLNHYDISLEYIRIPVKLSGLVGIEPLADKLISLGKNYYYKLKLVYILREPNYCIGVNAKTGEVEERRYWKDRDKLEYTDIAGHPAEKIIKELADYNIGYMGHEYRPNDLVTQFEFIELLLSTQSSDLSVESRLNKDYKDDLYRYAYLLGILSESDRNDTKQMTKAEVIKIIFDLADYDDVAALSSIYNTTYTDSGSIPQNLRGYAALAQGFKLITSNEFGANNTLTRADAAVILYNMMKR